MIDLTADSPLPRSAIKAVKTNTAPVRSLRQSASASRNVTTVDALSGEGRGKRLIPITTEHVRQPEQRPHTVRFASSIQLPSSGRYERGYAKNQQVSYATTTGSTSGGHASFEGSNHGDETLVDIDVGIGDPSLGAIVTVLNKLHQVFISLHISECAPLTVSRQVVVQNIANKFEGVKQDARTGRDELMRYAVADLRALRTER